MRLLIELLNMRILPTQETIHSTLSVNWGRQVYRLILSLTLLCLTAGAYAQEVRITGEVYDTLQETGLQGANIKIISADSTTVLGSDTTRYQMVTEKGNGYESTYADKNNGAVFSVTVPRQDAYIIAVEAEGFEPAAMRISPDARKNVLQVAPFHLLKRSRRLQEVVVTGTIIKMFYKGDTLVYNAAAFNVSQMESLRKLVEQLPGVTMKDGEIRVNGKHVDNLLISGKDFFNGNMDAALDNLPAYIVSRVKVYDKAGDQSELTGQDMHDKSYVMDVHLKRQYIGTWMAQIAADGGTNRMWGLQGFLMRFDDRQMFTLNVDANNLNENRETNDMCSTSDFWLNGHSTSRVARFSYYKEPDATWLFKADGSVGQTDANKRSWNNTETFLSQDNLMARGEDRLDTKDVTALFGASVRARKKGSWQHTLGYKYDYSRNRTADDGLSLSYYLPAKAAWEGIPLDSIIRMEEASRQENALLYSLLSPTLSRVYNNKHKWDWQTSLVFGTDLANLDFPVSYDTYKQHNYTNYRLLTYADDETDARRRYRDQHDHAFGISPQLEWVHKYEKQKRYDGVLKPWLGYSHRFGSASHPEYRLERMREWSERMGWRMESLGILPDGEWQNACQDEANSYHSTQSEDKAEAGLNLSHKILLKGGNSLQVDAKKSVYYQRRKLNYHREGRDYYPTRDGFFFKPYLSMKWKHENREGHRWMPEWEMLYEGNPSMPMLTQLLPIRDESDPLNRFLGNESLDNSFTHTAKLAYRVEHVKSGRSLYVGTLYRHVHNDIVTKSVYDAATGIRTYQPVNTSRTHDIEGRVEFSSRLDKKQRVYMTASVQADYFRTADLSAVSGQPDQTADIRNLALTPSLALNMGMNKWRVNGSWATTFRHISQPGYKDNLSETRLRLDINYNLPFGIQLASLVNTTFFSGSSQDNLNDARTNWDITLSKYLLNDNLALQIKVHDLLNDASTYRSEVTSTQRIENYTDVLPRYLLFSVSYRFNWTSKKNN